MKALLFVSVFFTSFLFFSQSNYNVDSIFSKNLNEYRKIKLCFHGNPVDAIPAHTIYVLDAQNDHIFDVVNDIIHFQLNQAAPILVVGIVSEKRNYDFLMESSIENDLKLYRSDMGNFIAFNSFFTDELIPHVKNKFNVANQQWVVGHSNGATFLLNQWLKNPNLFPSLFSAKILIDPNFMFMNNEISRKLNESKESYSNKEIVYLSRAYYPQSPNEWKQSSRIGYESLKKHHNNSNAFKFENFETKYNHYSVIPQACQNGFEFIFSQTIFNPNYYLNFLRDNCKDRALKNTEALNYMLSFYYRGNDFLAKKSASFIDSNIPNIGENNLDVQANFQLAMKFEDLKYFKSSLTLYKNCLSFLEKNNLNMDMETYDRYKNLIQSKIANLTTKAY